MCAGLAAPDSAKGGPGEGFFDRAGWGFCVCVVTDGPDAGSFGWAGGFGATWVADPVRDLTVIVLTQRMFEAPDAVQGHLELQAAARGAADALP